MKYAETPKFWAVVLMDIIVLIVKLQTRETWKFLSSLEQKSSKKKYLYPLLRGEIRSCFAMTEPNNAGSNPVKMSSVALKEGDEYVINGHKWFTSSCDGASFAIAMLVTDPEGENPHQRASQIIVPLDTPGFEFSVMCLSWGIQEGVGKAMQR